MAGTGSGMKTGVARKKIPGHRCFQCGKRKKNEAFSGKGHGRHQCNMCRNAERRGRRVFAALVPIGHDDERGFVDEARLELLIRFDENVTLVRGDVMSAGVDA